MRIFYDVDTQNDFMNEDGALYVPDAELIKPNLAELTKYAINQRISVVGSVDRHFGTEEYKHREGELKRWGGPFPDHCMDGTMGQWKIWETTIQAAPDALIADWLTQNNYDFGNYLSNPLIEKVDRKEIIRRWKEVGDAPTEKELEEAYKRIAIGIFDDEIDREVKKLRESGKKVRQTGLYFEKQNYDVFTNPNTQELLKRAGVHKAVVYGVATDYCVKAAVLGMQKRGIQCYVVEDAIKGVFPESTKTALEEMAKAGAKFVTTKQVLEGKI